MSIFSRGDTQTSATSDYQQTTGTAVPILRPPSFGTSLINRPSQSGGFGGGTILTSSQGDLKPTATAKKSLLGQ